jgi:hypothetical protein
MRSAAATAALGCNAAGRGGVVVEEVLSDEVVEVVDVVEAALDPAGFPSCVKWTTASARALAAIMARTTT